MATLAAVKETQAADDLDTRSCNCSCSSRNQMNPLHKYVACLATLVLIKSRTQGEGEGRGVGGAGYAHTLRARLLSKSFLLLCVGSGSEGVAKKQKALTKRVEKPNKVFVLEKVNRKRRKGYRGGKSGGGATGRLSRAEVFMDLRSAMQKKKCVC